MNKKVHYLGLDVHKETIAVAWPAEGVNCNPDKRHRDLESSTDSAMAGFAAHG
jgi:hypothetical protein